MRTYLTAVAITICLAACNKQSPVKPPTEGVGSTPDTTVTVTPPPPPPPTEIIETEPALLVAVTKKISSDIGGYYIGLPTHYKDSGSTKKYPLFIFIHGAGQYGNGGTDLIKVLDQATPKLVKQKLFPPSFTVGDKHYSFIVLAPQFAQYPNNLDEVITLINYAKANYPVDPSMIYISGLSIGSEIAGYVAANHPTVFAAMVPIAGITASQGGCENMVDAKLPIWAFHNNDDQQVYTSTTKDFITMYNSMNPAIPARLTLFSPAGNLGHDAWTRATDPSYKEDGKNIYEWMLQYTR